MLGKKGRRKKKLHVVVRIHDGRSADRQSDTGPTGHELRMKNTTIVTIIIIIIIIIMAVEVDLKAVRGKKHQHMIGRY